MVLRCVAVFSIFAFYSHFYFRAIAASAPVAQFDAPCDAFGRIITADYAASPSENCSDTIRSSWAAIDNITSTSKNIQNTLSF